MFHAPNREKLTARIAPDARHNLLEPFPRHTISNAGTACHKAPTRNKPLRFFSSVTPPTCLSWAENRQRTTRACPFFGGDRPKRSNQAHFGFLQMPKKGYRASNQKTHRSSHAAPGFEHHLGLWCGGANLGLGPPGPSGLSFGCIWILALTCGQQVYP